MSCWRDKHHDIVRMCHNMTFVRSPKSRFLNCDVINLQCPLILGVCDVINSKESAAQSAIGKFVSEIYSSKFL